MDRYVIVKQSPDQNEELRLAVTWGKSSPGRGHSQCKGPEDKRGQCDERTVGPEMQQEGADHMEPERLWVS